MTASIDRVQQWGNLVARSREDVELRHRLLTDPLPVLKEAGLEFPDEMEVRVVDDPEEADAYKDAITLLLALPRPNGSDPECKPPELSDDQLEDIDGGMAAHSLRSFSTFVVKAIIPTTALR